jgi:hypothetical protein
MDLRDAEVQLSAQRLRELMLWHGKDEGNLPPAATLANLSRDTIAAFNQLQLLRTQMSELRATLSQIFWTCDSSAVRRTVLEALGAPPEGEAVAAPSPAVGWAASPNGLPLPALAGEAERTQSTPHHAAG